jgi:rfaE bifunctional protein kinase chain/domain
MLKLPGKTPRIAVIGDIIHDEYLYCDVLGISPEDDVALKLHVNRVLYSPGGAANVARNIRSIGAQVELYGVVGADKQGAVIVNMFGANVYQIEGRPTTTKKRVLNKKGRHIVRIDEEVVTPIDDNIATKIADDVAAGAYDKIIVSDYAKGVVTDTLLDRLPVGYIIDPKRIDWSKYYRASIITPNKREFESVKNIPKFNHVSIPIIIETQSEQGSILHQNKKSQHFPVRKREFGDPTGCGDSFIAGLTVALTSGYSLEDAIRIANAAGACAYSRMGAYGVTINDINDELASFSY